MAATLYFTDLIRIILPMTAWWEQLDQRWNVKGASDPSIKEKFAEAVQDPEHPPLIPTGEKHGTHVAGILAGDWKASEADDALEEDLVGVCPDLNLYDLRVLDENGRGDEFSVMAALQFIRYFNATNDYMAVHGVNLSLSIPHDVANYACGRTPVCEECERVVSSGVVVVAAAGNQGGTASSPWPTGRISRSTTASASPTRGKLRR